MKKIITSILLTSLSFYGFSQSSGYNNLGVLFTKNDNYGSARFEAMSGAFGALGSDVSSTAINPAGGAVARNTKASITLGVNSLNVNTLYYNSVKSSQDETFNVANASGLLVFDSPEDSNWNRFVVSLNYSMKNDFNEDFNFKGKGDYLNFIKNPEENNTNPYNIGESQSLSKTSTGHSNVFNIGLSAVNNNKLFLGTSLNFHTFGFTEVAELNEKSEDVTGNILYATNIHDTHLEGEGFSMSLGLIYKLNDVVRLGATYETPTWYPEVTEETNHFNQDDSNFNFPGYIEIETTEPDGSNPFTYKSSDKFDIYYYKFKSPSRITASSAFVFGKNGLVSLDYTYQNYKGIKFRNGNFDDINNNFSEDYKQSHTINIGTEWRFNKFSVRGGFSHQNNPKKLIKNIKQEGNFNSFSAGLGYNFGNTSIDISYRRKKEFNFYKLYKSGDLTKSNALSRVAATVTFNL